jgi:hypothetical protein
MEQTMHLRMKTVPKFHRKLQHVEKGWILDEIGNQTFVLLLDIGVSYQPSSMLEW